MDPLLELDFGLNMCSNPYLMSSGLTSIVERRSYTAHSSP